MSEYFSTRWLFKILDYEHWELSEAGQPVGQIVLNFQDQSVALVPYDDQDVDTLKEVNWSFRRWCKWVSSHETVASAFGNAF